MGAAKDGATVASLKPPSPFSCCHRHSKVATWGNNNPGRHFHHSEGLSGFHYSVNYASKRRINPTIIPCETPLSPAVVTRATARWP